MGRHGSAQPERWRPGAAIPGRRASTRSTGALLALTGVLVAVLTVGGIVLMGSFLEHGGEQRNDRGVVTCQSADFDTGTDTTHARHDQVG